MDSVSPDAARQSPGSLWTTFLLWLIWILWLPLFIPALVDLFQRHRSPLWVVASLLGAAVFFALYLWVSWHSARSLNSYALRVFPSGLALWAPIISLFALANALTFMNGFSWGGLFIYTSSAAAGWLPTRKAAATIVALVVFVGVVVAWTQNVSSALSAITFVGIVGAIVVAFGWSAANSQQLRLAREEMARASAVNEERLRIARDLHDLLGHNLSLIALKSELARRLIAVAPERAANEIGDIEQAARTALQEVREAVANYRTPTLASELHNARAILEAAGVSVQFEGGEQAAPYRILPQHVEATLSWALREGVTNVIRHSRAHHCTILLVRGPDMASVTVTDDGVGILEASGTIAAGNGLRGLAERVAALGGDCVAGPYSGGGYRLLVKVLLHAHQVDVHATERVDAT